ncbi:MAG: NAD(+) synthase [Bacilli bacterium]|nr:NAD(+) synthase [Bacilli bacterium]
MKFDAKKEKEKIIDFIRDYYNKNHVDGAILGISGGKDSGVVAGLFVEALGKENVIGVTLPCHSIETDKSDAKLVSDYYGFPLYNFDLTEVYDTFKKELKNIGDFDEEDTKDSDINLKPRFRMATVYYLAALFSKLSHKTYLVAGTSNKCELYVGYFTKGGDSVHDISPIADLTVEEVIALGAELKVPEPVLYKAPNDGLSNKTDEDKLGVTYKAIADYIEDPNKVSEKDRKTIERLHKNNAHKFVIPTYRRG